MGDHNPTNGATNGPIDRRRFLQGTAGAIGIAALGTSGLAAAAPSRTVNLGDEGLEEGDDITPYLEEYWTSGTEVIIPGGSYGFSGDGDAFSIEAYEDSWLVGDGLVVFDTAYDFISVRVDNDAHVRYENLEWDDPVDGGIRVWTKTTGTTLEFVNVNIHGDPGTDDYGIYGAGDGENVGLLRFINCTVENFDDGLYMTSMFEGAPEDGQAVVEVYGGLYRNCTSANVRVGGDNSKVISVASVCNNIPSGISNANAIRVREAGANQTIRDCDLYVSDESEVGGVIVVNSDRFEGDRNTSVSIEDTRMHADYDDDYGNVALSDTHVEGDNLHLTGSLSSADTTETLEGSGPYTNIYTGSDAAQPTTQKRWVDPDTLEPVDGSGSSSDDDFLPEPIGDRDVSRFGLLL